MSDYEVTLVNDNSAYLLAPPTGSPHPSDRAKQRLTVW